MIAGVERVPEAILFLANPFGGLVLSFGLYYVYANRVMSLSASDLNTDSMKALEPAGIVVLVTGAGGAFKQVLIDSQAGARIAEVASAMDISVLVFAFLIAALVRVIQGSATVAMITAAGFAAPLLAVADVSEFDRALTVIAIAGGASVLSHVNDSGFWLVGRLFQINEAETLRTWTISTGLIAVTGLISVLFLSLLV